MRTQERWELTILPKLIKEFSPRIQKDLLSISLDFENLPELHTGSYIFGNVGSGKTILAVRLALRYHLNRYLKAETTTMNLIAVPDLLQELKNCFGNNDLSETQVVEDYSNIDLLVLDDLGAEKTSEWAFQTLYIIINRRYENLKTTIFTSNLSLPQLSQKLGDERIASRIFSMSTQILLDKDDRRQTPKK